ncbi:MAG: hypothetical protein OXR72_13795 [Gemmatimonadota bacterium]|nr:hypothetical protein [Gemmatimonadota bacterium]
MTRLSKFVLIVTCITSPAFSQLPPEIVLDKHLVELDNLLRNNDHRAALGLIETIVSFQKANGLTLPAAFHFKYATATFAVDSLFAARDAVNEYLSLTGKDGKHYKEALALLLKIEGEIPSPDTLCRGRYYRNCWRKVANNPDCHHWVDKWSVILSGPTWSGECKRGFASGRGRLSVVGNENIHGRLDRDLRIDRADRADLVGMFQNGKRVGEWKEKYSSANPAEEPTIETGAYVKGIRNGRWTRKTYWVRSKMHVSESGPYLDDLRHGNWTVRFSNRSGSGKKRGPYVEGKKHGHWVMNFDIKPEAGDFGHGPNLSEGPFVNGKTHGRWVWKFKHGYEFGGTCSGGKATGKWWSNHPRRGAETWHMEAGADDSQKNYANGHCKNPQ